jgi:hypothetical protein
MPRAPCWVVVWFAVCALACPPDSFGPRCVPCPPHTTCPAGGLSARDCRCVAGFHCVYFKQVRAVVTLNTTLSAFQHDTGGVRSIFVSGLAAAGGVFPDQVTIRGVQPIRGSRRVLPSPHEIIVRAELDGTGELTQLGRHLTGLHVDDEWTTEISVRVLAERAQPETPARI